jgi:hypothetical protein
MGRACASLLEAVLRNRVEALCARTDDLLAEPDAGAALVSWLHAVAAHAAVSRGLGPALTGYRADPDFSPHALIREAAQKLLVRAQREQAVAPTVAVDDILHLAHGIAVASESLPDPARGADTLIELVAHGLLRKRRRRIVS